MKDGTRDLKGVLGDTPWYLFTGFLSCWVFFPLKYRWQLGSVWFCLALKWTSKKWEGKQEYESMNDITSPSRRTPGEQKGQHKSHRQLLLMQESLRSEMLSLKTVYTHRGRWIQTLYSSGNYSKLKGKEWELNPYQNTNDEDMTSSRHM